MQATFRKHSLQFNTPGGTSRGVLYEKDSLFITLHEPSSGIAGTGECSIIPRLSIDDVPELEQTVTRTVEDLNAAFRKIKTPEIAAIQTVINNKINELTAFSALRFALETALTDFKNGENGLLFPSAFTDGKAAIPINGLIWMDSFDSMWAQAEQKAREGFSVLKMKVGALDFDEELYFVARLRRAFPHATLRLDANGAFPPEEAQERLQALAQFDIHSIEQPVRAGNIGKMAELCRKSPIAIALDEELIGIFSKEEKDSLLATVKPQYIILKPSLLGGFAASDEWIAVAEKRHIDWWVTSALESNIGLNAIAQWTFTKNSPLPQGLGTGGVFSNNIDTGLKVTGGKLYLERG